MKKTPMKTSEEENEENSERELQELIRKHLEKYSFADKYPSHVSASKRIENESRIDSVLCKLASSIPNTKVQIDAFDVEYENDDLSFEEDDIFDGYLTWSCENFNVEIRCETENYHFDYDDDESNERPLTDFRIRIVHRPHLQIRNCGHVQTVEQVLKILELLKSDQFEDAIRILFEYYGGGSRDGEKRASDKLEEIVQESWVRTTASAHED